MPDMIYRSDWPVYTLANDYDQVVELAADYVGQLSASEQTDVWGGTAARFYGLGSGRRS